MKRVAMLDGFWRAAFFTGLVMVVLVLGGGRAVAREWIVVVAPELRDAIAPLVDWRQAEGWGVTVLAPVGMDAWEKMSPEVAKRVQAAREKNEETCLLLVGDADPGAKSGAVSTGMGTTLRMKGWPTDRSWALLSGDAGRPLAVGRLPARTPAEARVMVGKILAWPERARELGAFPEARLIVGFHHAPKPFEKLGDQLGHKLLKELTTALPPAWRMHGLVHIDGSPWQVIFEELRGAVQGQMEGRSTLLVYMGHSTRTGGTSKWTPILTDRDWRALPGEPGPRTGLFFTCGCNACEVTGAESYGLVAMRAPGGPAAVIGSQGETFGAMGYLAAKGLVETLAQEPAPGLLGNWWLGVQRGLAQGEMEAADFGLLDTADGSQGRVPLAAQRAEHLEMWMLLGDPAMPMVAPRGEIAGLKVEGVPAAGRELMVTGVLPEGLSAGAKVSVTFERMRSDPRADLPAIPPMNQGKEAERAANAVERRRRADDVVLSRAERVEVKGRDLRAVLKVPGDWRGGDWVVRVEAGAAGGVVGGRK